MTKSIDEKQKRIEEAAARALQEAKARKDKEKAPTPLATEKGGQEGPEPTRFGDWEKGGLTSDF